MAAGGLEDYDPLFTLDVVREFMMSKGGKLTNHDLVTHFKSFLNDPRRKVANRQKFKEYVNTLATIKLDPSGEKVLVIKKKFRDSFYGGSAPVVVKNSTGTHAKPEKKTGVDPKRAKRDKDDTAAAQLVDGSQPTGVVEDEHNTDEKENQMTGSCENLVDMKTDDAKMEVEDEDASDKNKSEGTTNSVEDTGILEDRFVSPPDAPSNLGAGLPASSSSLDDVALLNTEPRKLTFDDNLADEAQLPSAAEDKLPDKNADPECSTGAGNEKPVDEVQPTRCADDEVDAGVVRRKQSAVEAPVRQIPVTGEDNAVSVRERAQNINKIISPPAQSTAPVLRTQQQGTAQLSKPRRERERESRRAEDTSYETTMNEAEREWTIRSAYSDYQAMAKLLQTSPTLAGRRDFMTGYTALHWAAKNGSTDVIKLLFGSPNPPDVNAKSHGGYTPLHIAAMHGREEVIELLVSGYRADPNIRDYSGGKAKKYLPGTAQTHTHQLLLPSRRGLDLPLGAVPRSNSYNAKIGQASYLGINAGPAIRDSWATASSTSPGSSPGPGSRKGSVGSDSGLGSVYSYDAGLMPPPRDLPAVIRRKPVTSTSSTESEKRANTGAVREKESHSDSEMPSAGTGKDLKGSESVPDFGSLV